MERQPDLCTSKSQALKNQDHTNLRSIPTNPIPLPPSSHQLIGHMIGASKPLQIPDTSQFQINTTTPNQRRFIIFDHTGNLTTFMFSSVNSTPHNPTPKKILLHPDGADMVVPTSTGVVNQSSISYKMGANERARNEDMDEIDALLHSEDDDEEEDHIAGQFPLSTIEPEEEVASSGGPTSRKRPYDESDPSLLDTASSARAVESAMEEGDSSSCVEGGTTVNSSMETEEFTVCGGAAKRLRIHEAVCVLRGLVPGCMAKTDAVVVLDEAIRYLKSLEVKAKALGIAL